MAQYQNDTRSLFPELMGYDPLRPNRLYSRTPADWIKQHAVSALVNHTVVPCKLISATYAMYNTLWGGVSYCHAKSKDSICLHYRQADTNF